KLKRAILKEVYTENSEALRGDAWLLHRRRRETRPSFGERVLPFVIALLVLLPLASLGGYFLYPQSLAAIGLGWSNKMPPARVSVVSVEKVATSEAAGPSQPFSREEPVQEKGPFPEAQSEGEFLFTNSPENYHGLVDPKDVSIAALFDLGVKTIAIDPGHGGRDPGALGRSGLMEKEVTLDIAGRLRDRLERHLTYRILMTRDVDVTLSLKDRAEFANEKGADLFISIHVNSIPAKPLMIIETYFFGAQADQQTLEIAEKENQGSEYLMAEFRGMIMKISDKFKQQESETLARSIQKNLFLNIRHQNGTAVSRGIKSAPFIVLLGADMPSVLTEVSCISSQEEERKLADPAYREEIAGYLEGGIVQYLEKSKKKTIKGVTYHANRK
ncbi:MAG: N-acetylmuramoyl-L-alanine amidase, partial [Desulfobacterales bacterium]|nr:N-acetylmuramoyl-L-alanine amidase [Desulfobacterales bacterium]